MRRGIERSVNRLRRETATGQARSRIRTRAKVTLVAACIALGGLASSAALAQTLGDVTGQVTSTVDDILSTGTDGVNSTTDDVNSAVGSVGGTSGSGSGDTSGSGSGGTSSATSSAEETVGGLTTSEKGTSSGSGSGSSSSSSDSNRSAFADACGRQVGDQTFGAFMASVRDSRGGGGPSGSQAGDSQPFAGGVSGSGSGNTAPEAAPTPAQPAIPPPDGIPTWLGVAALAVLVLGLAALLALVARSLLAGRATTQTAGAAPSGAVRRSV
jgi:hypothetical protein